MVLDGCRSEACSRIQKRGDLISIEQEHIQFAVSIEIAKREGDRHQVMPRPVKDRACIEYGFTCVSPWKLDHLQMTVQIEREKMACARPMPYRHIHLEGAWISIVHLILVALPPGESQVHPSPSGYHHHHGQPHVHEPMDA